MRTPLTMVPGQVIRDLGDGFILRWSTRADANAVGELSAIVFHIPDSDQPNERVRRWASDLVGRPHPTMREGCATVVEDTRAKRLVSSMCLIPQTWCCEDLAFPVARPELVVTREDCRRRGFVRAQFEAFHAWSEGRGDRMQAITGIPWYYRQFGYELALDLGGGRRTPIGAIPAPDEKAERPYRTRRATANDLPAIRAIYEHSTRDLLYTLQYSEDVWRYDIDGRSPDTGFASNVVETADGEVIGWFVHPFWKWEGRMHCYTFWLLPGHSYRAVTPCVAEALLHFAEHDAQGYDEPIKTLFWELGDKHPLYDAYAKEMSDTVPPFAWYIRVPDIAGFVDFLRPVLDRRLEQSAFAGHTGTVTINGFTWGMRLTIDRGRVESVVPCQIDVHKEPADADFPNLTFLMTLMGRRTLDEINHIYPDCKAKDEAHGLIDALFPQRHSRVIGVA
jgi:hypothetical protein